MVCVPKLTGGQRLEICLVRNLHQLPEIWEKLINAGFKNRGMLYGKSLRTVKSCALVAPGDSYGVDDSVGLAIYLENRYEGLTFSA